MNTAVLMHIQLQHMGFTDLHFSSMCSCSEALPEVVGPAEAALAVVFTGSWEMAYI